MVIRHGEGRHDEAVCVDDMAGYLAVGDALDGVTYVLPAADQETGGDQEDDGGPVVEAEDGIVHPGRAAELEGRREDSEHLQHGYATITTTILCHYN